MEVEKGCVEEGNEGKDDEYDTAGNAEMEPGNVNGEP
jgi:hypothetical protein